MKERGRGLNEAITERLTLKVLRSIYGANYQPRWIAYQKEQEIIEILEKKYEIPFDLFAKAAISRDAFRELVKAINNKRPNFMTIIYSLMEYDIQTTKKFLNGEQIIINKEIRKYLHPSLLKDGFLKTELSKAYPNLLDQKSLEIVV